MKTSWKIFRVLLGLAALALLLGSFPIRALYGTLPCYGMRGGGLLLLFVYLGMGFWAANRPE